MGEDNPYYLNEMSWEILQIYIKYGGGEFKVYNTSYFTCLNDEVVMLTLNEFAEKATDYNGNLWKNRRKES